MQYFTNANARIFDVYIEGALVVDNIDVYALAPGGNIPYIVAVPTFVKDTAITIDFVRNKQNPQINGIEVLYTGAPISAPVKAPVVAPITPPIKAPVQAPSPVVVPIKPPTKAPVLAPILPPANAPLPTTGGNIVHRINCGSTKQVVVPPNNVVWTQDQYSSSGLSFDTCGDVTTSIHCTSRYFRTTDAAPHRYNLPVAVSNRMYTVRLHFAEQVRYFSLYIQL